MSMILYNYRYRGPYEYDKFILNTLQLVNEMDLLEKKFFTGDYGTMESELNDLNELIDSLTGENCKLQQQLLFSLQVE